MPQLASKSADLGMLELVSRTMAQEIRDLVRTVQPVEEAIGQKQRDEPMDVSCVEDHVRALCRMVIVPMVQSGNNSFQDFCQLADILERGADGIRVFSSMVGHIDPDTRQAIIEAVLNDAASQPSEARMRELRSHAVLSSVRSALASHKSSALQRFDMLLEMVGMGNAGIGIFVDGNKKVQFEQWRPTADDRMRMAG